MGEVTPPKRRHTASYCICASLGERDKCLNPCDNRPIFKEPMTDMDSTLAERGNRYGSFPDHAKLSQGFHRVAAEGRSYAKLDDDMLESLAIIFNKLGRILNGDPSYSDSWHDIAGYATLVDKRLKALGK